MENYIKLSTLNDFIFCPKSIYYHNLYDNYNKKIFQAKTQIRGSLIHKNIDKNIYSSSKNILSGADVYCEKYKICGKIDLFYIDEGKLVERKYKLDNIYIGQKYQLRGQMFCLEEMGYNIKSLYMYAYNNNIMHKIEKPNTEELCGFENMLEKYRTFDIQKKDFSQNLKKCEKCIYRELCDYFI